MEPDREGQEVTLQPRGDPKRKRFRIVKLEERIAPKKGGQTNQWCSNGTYWNCTPATNKCDWSYVSY